MHLFYITDIFPAVSQIFISRELAGLERLGAKITMLSLQKPRDEVEHALNNLIRTRCYWAGDLPATRIDKAVGHFSALNSRPKSYLTTYARSRAAGLPSLRNLFRQLPLYCRLIRESGAQRIHCHFGRQGMLVGWLAGHLLGLPFSVTLHGSDILYSPYENLGLVLADADLIICVSEKIRTVVRQNYAIDSRKLAVIRCGISLPEYRIAPVLPGPAPLKILCVARLHPVKGIDDLVAACSLLRERQVEFQCLIVGDGEMRHILQNQAKNLGLSAFVHFTGALPNEKLPEIYAQSSIFVLPSHSEGLGVVLMEAMASGLPVVATDVGGIPELVASGDNGLLVEPCQPNALADAVQKIAGLPRAEREGMGRRNRQKVQELFNSSIETGKLFHLFKEKANPLNERPTDEKGFFHFPYGSL